MAIKSTLITSFLDDCNIDYEVDEDDFVSFSYDERFFVGFIDAAGVINTCLDLGLPRICEVPSIEKKKYLRLINWCNEQVPIVKFTLDEDDNFISVNAQVSLDSNPDLDDLFPELIKLLCAAQGYFNDKINNLT